jgi:multiple sugar transport system ATP-binding protein
VARLVVQNLSKTYAAGRRQITALSGVTFELDESELLVIVGPSGSGKTTLLRIIAGLEVADTGDILLEGKSLAQVAPKDRDMAMVFQNPALHPHLSVRQNIGFGLRLRRVARQEIQARVEEAAEWLNLKHLLDQAPDRLSGGERQRVALARALVRHPALFLLDEPLSSLDAPARATLRFEIASLQKRLRRPMIYVTHDQTEAMALGGALLVLAEGRIQQLATAPEVYNNPANLTVAGFIGLPQMNFLRGCVCCTGNAARFQLEATDSTALCLGTVPAPLPQDWLNRPVVLGIRPERLHLNLATENANATIEQVEFLGPYSLAHLQLGGQKLLARLNTHQIVALGQKVEVSLNAADARFFDRDTGDAVLCESSS